MNRQIAFAIAIQILTSAAEAELLYPTQRLVASNRRSHDRFGDTIVLDGDSMLVGVPMKDGGTTNSGGAYFFHRDSTGTWSQVQEVLPNPPKTNYQFGRTLAIDGDTAIINAGDDINFYHRSPTGVWNLTDSLRAIGILSYYGWSIDVSGDTAIITAPGESATKREDGAAYVYRSDAAGQWNYVTKLVGSQSDDHDQFGSRVAIHGNTAVVSAIYGEATDEYFHTGLVYVFQNDGLNGWQEVSLVSPEEPSFGAAFGASLAFDGRLLVVGAPQERQEGFYAGAAYVFECDAAGKCHQSAKLLSANPREFGYFGSATGILDDRVVIGGNGEVSIFRLNESGSWELDESITGLDLGASPFIGQRLAADNTTLVVSDVLDSIDRQQEDLGAVYALVIPEPCCVQLAMISTSLLILANYRKPRV